MKNTFLETCRHCSQRRVIDSFWKIWGRQLNLTRLTIRGKTILAFTNDPAVRNPFQRKRNLPIRDPNRQVKHRFVKKQFQGYNVELLYDSKTP